jgi:hypothetical protein
MAQDMWAALGLGEAPDRISTIDADGAIVAALRGLSQRKRHLVEQGLDAVGADLATAQRKMERHSERLAASRDRLAALQRRLDALVERDPRASALLR